MRILLEVLFIHNYYLRYLSETVSYSTLVILAEVYAPVSTTAAGKFHPCSPFSPLPVSLCKLLRVLLWPFVVSGSAAPFWTVLFGNGFLLILKAWQVSFITFEWLFLQIWLQTIVVSLRSSLPL